MNILLKFIRDPIWQAAGVIVSMLGLFFSTSTPSPTNGELAIIRSQSISFSDYLLPSKLLNLNFQTENKNMDGAIVDYYLMVNKGDKPILPSDYTAPITADLKESGEIFFVDSCTGTNKSPTNQSVLSCRSGSFVNSTWQHNERIWTQDPALLNPGENFCVIVIKKFSQSQPNVLVSWSGRIAGSKISTYTSLDEYAKTLKKGIVDYIKTYIRMDGFAAYWFAALQTSTFYSILLLARQANWHRTKFGQSIWPTVIAMLLSTSTSEILVDIFINQNYSNLSPIVWPLLATHLWIILYLFVRAVKIRLSTTMKNSADSF